MKMTKKETLIFEGLGFPITLINAPQKKVLGEWVLDLDLNKLQAFVLRLLVHKTSPLTGAEIRFMRSYLEMSLSAFGKLFRVTHVSVLKWETEQTRLSPTTEIYIRLYILNYLHAKDREFRKLYEEISLENLSRKKIKQIPLKINVEDLFLLAS